MTIVTWIESESRVPYWEIRKLEVKHSVENLVVKSSSVDAEVAVPNAARQQDSPVETDEQDSKMSLVIENDPLSTAGQRGNSICETRVNDDFRRQQVDVEDGELQSMSHKLMKMTVNQLSNSEMYSSSDEANLDKDEEMYASGWWQYMKMPEQDDVGASTYIVVNLLQKRVPEVVERRFL